MQNLLTVFGVRGQNGRVVAFPVAGVASKPEGGEWPRPQVKMEFLVQMKIQRKLFYAEENLSAL